MTNDGVKYKSQIFIQQTLIPAFFISSKNPAKTMVESPQSSLDKLRKASPFYI